MSGSEGLSLRPDMAQKLYIIRHCQAHGQPAESPLTDVGLAQAEYLAQFFSNTKVNRIISSPFKRAIQSVTPLSEETNITLEIDERLSERVLSTTDLPNWLEKLKATFDDVDLKFDGGESSKEAMKRITEVVDEVFSSDAKSTILVTHGNLMSLLLRNYDSSFGFTDWQNLTNPDVFLLSYKNNTVVVERVWKGE
ncbi:histidine phosphatase family protein [Sutcliffiella rhizosphaerae]|nr:histidine phosphatase family protein [Sutcliffiella rhizosphaerae]